MTKKTGHPGREKPFLEGEFLLRKYPGKGGWTYLSLPAPEALPKARFGTRYVKGMIDDVQVRGQSLWSTRSGDLFFPVKAALRKALGKEAGDTVAIVLYHDPNEIVVPEDFRLVLAEEPQAGKKFRSLSPGRQRELITWIDSSKREETRINRMAEALRSLAGE